jgi:hypothetical protein
MMVETFLDQNEPSMKAILVRVGVDHAYGGWNAPMDPKTGQFVFVPIPDGGTKVYTPGNARKFTEIDSVIREFATAREIPRLRCPEALRQLNMHLDPDFDHLTYGDNGTRRGAGISKLVSGDLLVFYAGLRSIVPAKQLMYALVGLYVVEKVVRAVEVPPEKWHENAHTRWAPISENDIVVCAKRGLSGRLDRCIPIGEWRDGAYRVSRPIEDAWGGLTVKNGYIQRSAVPPRFVDAEKFYGWFQQQGRVLIERNN